METILSLAPGALWKHFYSLTQVPRPSGHMQPVIDFMLDFGKKLGLDTQRDKIGNVLIKKPATSGMENKPTVILQGHLDMVPQANSNIQHDFLKDPIQAYVDGEWVKAKDTTLGADNGIGAAAMMAILESTDLPHGPLEALFTVDEETGMYGAFDIQPGFLSGTILLNTDTERDKELCIGCAGGINVNFTSQYKEAEIPEGDIAYKISLKGLKGGHSGVDIHLGRANANKLLFRFLKETISELDICLSSFQGGTLHNAIPREAFATITIQPENESALLEMLEEYKETIIKEYETIEDSITLIAEKTDLPTGIVPEEIQDSFVNAMEACPDGVSRMIPTIPDTVETSDNLSVVKIGNGEMDTLLLVRSSSDSRKDYLVSSIESAFAITGAKTKLEGNYSGWNPNVNSPILKVMENNYKELFKEEPEVVTVHAGLECGVIGAIVPGLNMVSFGPTIMHPHSPDEKVNIASVEKFWKLLTATLAKL